MEAPNTLGLDDDLDGAEVLQSLEASFGVKFRRSEAESCWTVGDLYTLLQSHLIRDDPVGSGCASAMAFYRLRRTIAKTSRLTRLSPTTPLKDVSTLPPRALFDHIRADTRMRLPHLEFSGVGWFGVVLLSGGVIGLLMAVGNLPNWKAFSGLAAVLGAVLMRRDRGRFPQACQSLGDLARMVAGLNFGALMAAGAGCREKDLWSALIEVLAEHSSIPKTEIRPETALLQSQVSGPRAWRAP